MLTHLTIKNYALIRELELPLSRGLNVITGETGAGKSILLGAIGLLTGNRADTKVLWNDREKCVTEGVFNIGGYGLRNLFEEENLDYDERQTVIRREISPGGKSRAFINDTPVTLEVMKKIGALLLDIHSQHEALLPGQQSFQLRLLDVYAANQQIREHYQETWEAFVAARDKYEQIRANADQLRKDADYVNFQLDEFTRTGLSPGEQGQLETELQVQDHAEEIKLKLSQAIDLLERSEYAGRRSVSEAKLLLAGLRAFNPTYQVLYERIESLIIELDDVVAEMAREEENVVFDPQRATYLKERLSTIYRLQQKHAVNSVEELLRIQAALEEKARDTASLDEDLARAEAAFRSSEASLQQASDKLSATRTKVCIPLTNDLKGLLADLGIPQAEIKINLYRSAPAKSGGDKAEMLFSANAGIPPKPLSQVASGGEFSRLMLSIKYLMAEKTAMPTLILDEIDSGVSGEIAIKLGNLMKKMAAGHQLITITHLPQIAAKGDEHYFVYKESATGKTISNIRLLTEAERLREIAQMIGGAEPSKGAVEGARALLENGSAARKKKTGV